MANKSLTDLTARTATADSDLIHVNSGGTDYKETKRNFLQGDLYITFANDSPLTSQVGALPVGTFFGKLNGYGHQSETGMPANANWIVRATRYATSNCILDAWPVGNADLQYRITQSSSTWESSWTKLPQRAEITSLNNSLTYKSYSVTVTSNAYVSPFSYYGSLSITADRTAYGTPIAVNVTGGATSNVAQAKMSGNSVYIYSKSEETFTVYVLYCKEPFLTVV